MTAPPPQLVDWWLGMSSAEREAFVSDPTLDARARANLGVVEHYCRTHCYTVFCNSTLQPPPFALEVLSSAAAQRPLAALLAPPPASPLCGIGLRGSDAPIAAAERVDAAVQQLEQLFIDHALQLSDEQRSRLARLLVSALREAAVAAAYREHRAASFEAEANDGQPAKVKLSLLQSAKREGADSHAGSSVTDGTSPRAVVSAARPIQSLLSEARGVEGVQWLLVSAPPRARAAGGKRRERAGGCDFTTAAADTAQVLGSTWAAVRAEHVADRLPQGHPTLTSSAAYADANTRVSASTVHITAQDMHFALRQLSWGDALRDFLYASAR